MGGAKTEGATTTVVLETDGRADLPRGGYDVVLVPSHGPHGSCSHAAGIYSMHLILPMSRCLLLELGLWRMKDSHGRRSGRSRVGLASAEST